MEKHKSDLTRRDFMGLAGASLFTIPLLGLDHTVFKKTESFNNDPTINLFSKHLQFLNYSDMSEAAAEMGFDGLDLTVRPHGHVLPERVADDLPRAVEAMNKFGLQPQMMTTNVTNAANPEHKTVLENASKLAFKYYRMGWLSYPEEKTISESMESYAKQFETLATLNKKLGLHGGYQNHAGNHVGAPIWDLYPILKGQNANFIGCQYDIRHATVEGGSSWELGLRRIHPYIKTIVIKDFKWGIVNDVWKPINTPLGEGMVDFKRFFGLLKKYKISAPISLHLEYELGGAEKGNSKITMSQKEVFGKMRKDLEYLKNTWNSIE